MVPASQHSAWTRTPSSRGSAVVDVAAQAKAKAGETAAGSAL